MRPSVNWQLRTRSLELGRRTLVMGVVNITPDSFSDGGRYATPQAAIARGLELLDQGAAILDLGAESTRPGSHAGGSVQAPTVSAEEEQARLLPVIEGILKLQPGAVLSADTYKAATARAALNAGAEIVNDVSGFFWDSEMPAVCAQARCGVVLMHSRGRPEEWAAQSILGVEELLHAVRTGLDESLNLAARAGIPAQSVVLDPGYGFGKRLHENYALLARQADLLQLGRPLLVGLSRKSFLGRSLSELYASREIPPAERDTASLAAMVTAILHGASIVRVHTVRAAAEAACIADAVLAST